MLTISVCNDSAKVARFFEENQIKQNENSLCLVANDGKCDIGFSLFDIDKDSMTVRFISPLDDLGLADGILRSTLHVGAERFIFTAFYASTVPEEFLNKIGFIKNIEEKTLDMDKLFKGCQSCNK